MVGPLPPLTDARQAIKLLGGDFLSRYPRSEHNAAIAFNIARAHYFDQTPGRPPWRAWIAARS